ncbi:MAG TPA: hypothetical protein VHF91_01885 [Acidimicrobiales bacterium]|nr:hypothetical protein [Acidimicrobiales bacterium]
MTRRPRKVTVAAVLALVVVAGGCARVQSEAAPTCVPKGPDTLALVAQSVPTASKVPCISSYPAGWHFASMSVEKGRSRFTLDSDRAGISAVRVSLEEVCDVDGATEISSDEPGTRRFERIISVVDDFKAVRSYLFDGGCTTYQFDFDRQGRALVNEVSVAIGFIDRTAIDALVRQRSKGELHL